MRRRKVRGLLSISGTADASSLVSFVLITSVRVFSRAEPFGNGLAGNLTAALES